MKTISYKFADGTVSTVEVNDELYTEIKEIEKQEKHSHWQNTRGVISLDVLQEKGIDFADESGNFYATLGEETEEEQRGRLHNAISKLKPSQQKLIKQFFYDGLNIPQIAEIERLNKSSISRQLQTIYKKLKKLL